MVILAIGDVVGSAGCEFLRSHLPALKKLHGVDLVIANGENSADGNGLTPFSAEHLFASGVDVITTEITLSGVTNRITITTSTHASCARRIILTARQASVTARWTWAEQRCAS
jgi:calcineurin-like phosphoesterase